MRLKSLLFLWLSVAVVVAGCKDSYVVGDHVVVDWEGNDYPAVVLTVEGPARYRIHYDGYDQIWDENVNATRIRGRLKGVMTAPPPPAKVLKRGGAPAASSSADGGVMGRFKVGERVRVEWNGKIYTASVIDIVGPEKYKVHYDGFGAEWDETIDGIRIQAPR